MATKLILKKFGSAYAEMPVKVVSRGTKEPYFTSTVDGQSSSTEGILLLDSTGSINLYLEQGSEYIFILNPYSETASTKPVRVTSVEMRHHLRASDPHPQYVLGSEAPTGGGVEEHNADIAAHPFLLGRDLISGGDFENDPPAIRVYTESGDSILIGMGGVLAEAQNQAAQGAMPDPLPEVDGPISSTDSIAQAIVKASKLGGSGGGGGGGSEPLTPNSLPSVVSFCDDEFETATLDTTGARRAGSLPWTLSNANSHSTAVQSDGSLVLTHGWNEYSHIPLLAWQDAPGYSSSWSRRTKISSASHANYGGERMGIFLGDATTGVGFRMCASPDGLTVSTWSDWSTITSENGVGTNATNFRFHDVHYMRVSFTTGTGVVFGYSRNGVRGCEYTRSFSVGIFPTPHIGLFVSVNTGLEVYSAFDFFRGDYT